MKWLNEIHVVDPNIVETRALTMMMMIHTRALSTGGQASRSICQKVNCNLFGIDSNL